MKILARRLWLPVVLLTLLSACSTTVNHYRGTQPSFAMEDFFDGQLKAYGMIQNRSGEVIRRFTVDLLGTWEGANGLLEEDFIYDDGETQRRVWHLVKLADGHYQGTASDVEGVAAGTTQGFAFNWSYTLEIEVDDTLWAIDLDDWIYQIDANRVVNRTEMTKWGFKVGEITLVIEKEVSPQGSL
jgi:hypothetical protein